MPYTVSRTELLIDGKDEFFRRTLHDTLGFGARLQEARNLLAEAIGLSGPAYSILVALDHLGRREQVGISALGAHLHLSGAFVTIEVNKLVKAGLVEKCPHPEDGRRVILHVTKRGQDRLASLIPLQQEVNNTIFAGISEEQFRVFGYCMSTLLTGTEEALMLMRLRSEQRRRG